MSAATRLLAAVSLPLGLFWVAGCAPSIDAPGGGAGTGSGSSTSGAGGSTSGGANGGGGSTSGGGGSTSGGGGSTSSGAGGMGTGGAGGMGTGGTCGEPACPPFECPMDLDSLDETPCDGLVGQVCSFVCSKACTCELDSSSTALWHCLNLPC